MVKTKKTKVYINGDWLIENLIKKNKSQTWLCYKLEMSSGYLSQIMRRDRCPSAKMREKILRVVNKHLVKCTFDDLFYMEHS
jgi:hypothetical protein